MTQMHARSRLAAVVAILSSVPSLAAGEPSEARVRAAAAKTLTVIQTSQRNWYQKESCISCHQQVLPALAFQAAREHGVPLDEQAAQASSAAAWAYLSNFERAVEFTHVIDPSMNDGYALVAANAAGVRPSVVTAVYARLIASRQEADGHWETSDERPPESYSPFTATAISIRAVRLYAHASQKAEIAARASKAQAWLLSHQPRATEERVFQLFGAVWTGADKTSIATMAAALTRTQQSDGGWNSRDGLASDAYSTGQALLALHEAGGVATTDRAWQRGVDFLLSTQAADGTWHVISRQHPPAPVSPPYFETGHPYGHDQFISMMGECLAVMALTDSLVPVKPAAVNVREAEPAGIEPWAETMLFGSAADVKKLLDSGLSPNSATRNGGITALMLAAPDTAKLKLLIDRGANVEARSKNRYSALMIAAQYPGSEQAMNLLLDHGAKVRLAKDQGAPLFNAFPTYLAAFSGDAGIIARLHKEGDRIDDKMNLIGMFPTSPLLALATTHRVETARALLDAGAKVDAPDGDGITSLGWAAISNRVEMASLLIQRGANVNHVDKKGMTPLLYAASVDFGDSSMIDLLLRSGARTDLRTKEGKTALELARQYKRNVIVASLEGPRAAR